MAASFFGVGPGLGSVADRMGRADLAIQVQRQQKKGTKKVFLGQNFKSCEKYKKKKKVEAGSMSTSVVFLCSIMG